MSHYCCKRCGQRYEVCHCTPLPQTYPAPKLSAFRKFRHFSLDLETFSLRATARIATIGIIAFDMDGTMGPHLHIAPKWEEDVEGHLDQETIDWWHKPEQAAAKKRLTNVPRFDNQECVSKVRSFLARVCPTYESDPKSLTVWAMGSEFDPVILNEFAIRTTGSSLLHRKSLGDVRLLHKFFSTVPRVKPAYPHDALSDAKAQASHIISCSRVKMTFLANPLTKMHSKVT